MVYAVSSFGHDIKVETFGEYLSLIDHILHKGMKERISALKLALACFPLLTETWKRFPGPRGYDLFPVLPIKGYHNVFYFLPNPGDKENWEEKLSGMRSIGQLPGESYTNGHENGKW